MSSTQGNKSTESKYLPWTIKGKLWKLSILKMFIWKIWNYIWFALWSQEVYCCFKLYLWYLTLWSLRFPGFLVYLTWCIKTASPFLWRYLWEDFPQTEEKFYGWTISNSLKTSNSCCVFKHQYQRRQWHPTPVLLPGQSHGRRSLVGCSPWGLEESNTSEWLHFHFSLWCIGEGNGNPLQCSCLENPRDGGAW